MQQAVAEPLEKLLPDSVGDSVQVVLVHFDANYELPLQVEPAVAMSRFVTQCVSGFQQTAICSGRCEGAPPTLTRPPFLTTD